MRFGDEQARGIHLNRETLELEVINSDDQSKDVLVHDESNATIARLLIDLHMPVALGVIYRQQFASFENKFYSHHVSDMQRTKSVADFMKGPNSWVVD